MQNCIIEKFQVMLHMETQYDTMYILLTDAVCFSADYFSWLRFEHFSGLSNQDKKCTFALLNIENIKAHCFREIQ